MTPYTSLEGLAKSAKEVGMAVAADPNEVLRLIEIARAAEAIPAGWKLVPVEASAAMVAAVSSYSKDQLAAHATWDAMVKAAPPRAALGTQPVNALGGGEHGL